MTHTVVSFTNLPGSSVLATICPQGNPAWTASKLLTAFLPDESFMYEEIIFDLATDQFVARHTAEMVEFIKTLQR
jgi:hypothetical protein